MKTTVRVTILMMMPLLGVWAPTAASTQNPWDVTPTGIAVIEKGLNVLQAAVGPVSAPSFAEGTEVQITCLYKYLAGPASTPPEWFVDIEVDGARVARLRAYNHEWKSSSSSGFDPSKISSGGFYSTSSTTIVDKAYPAIATWKAAGGGTHTVRCVLDPDHRLPEANEANNLTERKIQVKVPLVALKNALGSSGGSREPTSPRVRAADQPAGEATLNPKVNVVPGTNTKSCRTSLSAKVALEPSELGAPGFQPAPGGVPEPKLTLYLQDSGAKGNSVFCDYASNKGDVKLSTTLQCKDATSTPGVPHSYRCSP